MLKNSDVHQSKLFALLRTLNKKEVRELGLWLQSPIHNPSNEVRLLFEGIKSINKHFNRPVNKLTLLKFINIQASDQQGKSLSPKEEKTLREVMHKLTGQVQEYIVWKSFKANEFQVKYYTLDAFLGRKLYKYLPHQLEKTQRELEARPYRDIAYHEDAFQLNEVEFFLSVILRNRRKKTEIQDVIDSLRHAYLSKLLKYYCSAMSHEKMLQVKYDYPFIDFVKQFIEESSDKEIPTIRVYFSLLKLIETNETSHFYDLKNYLFGRLDLFDLNEVRQFFNHLTNYCNLMIKAGQHEFVREQHEIYKQGLSLKCWSIEVNFSNHQFTHIIKNALQLGETTWADTFVEEYQHELATAVREDMVNYYFALKYFYQKQFDQAQDYLSQVGHSEDFTYNLNFKILLIKIYYESNNLTIDNLDTHPINYELETMRQNVSVRNKRMSEIFRQAYNNFVNVFRRILDRKKKLVIGEQLSRESIARLENNLPDISPLVEKNWLEEQIENLKK